MERKMRQRERDAIIQSLRSGVTPRTGLQHIQVGRKREVQGVLKDINCIIDGGAAFRLIIGEFGAGKSFFLQLIRTIALEKGLVCIHADLNPNRRLQSSGGQARNLYCELMHNMSTRTKPEGNALKSVVERFVSETRKQAEQNGEDVVKLIKIKMERLSEMVGGYDFAQVIASYWKSCEEENEQLGIDAIRWLRAEFSTKTEARKSLNVRNIIDDSGFYDYLKLLGVFVHLAGYKGLLVNLDEMVNLHKMGNSKSRVANYEALHSRLKASSFAQKSGFADYSAPVLHISNLLPEEVFILLCNLRHVFAGGEAKKYLLPDEALYKFLEHCNKQIGSAYFRTPRNTIKAFIDILVILEQNSGLQWESLIDDSALNVEQEAVDNLIQSGKGLDNELSSFRL